MKKFILIILALAIVFAAASWLAIPTTLTATSSLKANCNSQGAFRSLVKDGDINKYLQFSNGNHTNAAITQLLTGGAKIAVVYQDKPCTGALFFIPAGTDSTFINCQLSFSASINPFQRLLDYRTKISLEKDVANITKVLQERLSIFENVYNFKLTEASTPDSFFVNIKKYSPTYPGVDFIYTQIHYLEKFSKQQGAIITGSPMLNISNSDTAGYLVKIALPINKFLPPKENVTSGRMVPGKFIVTDVTGGPYTIQKKSESIHNYFQDYSRVTMAIPFQYLITNREKETDTAKWVTKIYSPVY